MPIEFRCPQCQKLLRTGDDTTGKKAKCPECGTVVAIPQSSTAGPATPPAGSIPPAEPPGPFGQPPRAAQGAASSNPFQSGSGPAGPAAAGFPAFGSPPGGPDNPYQSPSGFVPGPSPSLTPQGQVQPTPIDVGDVMTRAWEIFKDRMGICVGAPLLVGLLCVVPGLIVYGFMMIAFQMAPHPAMLLVLPIFYIALVVYCTWLGVGQTILFLKIARGQPAGIRDLFTGGPFLITTILASILFQLAVSVGYVFCIVPGVIVLLMFSQFAYLIVDQRLGVIDSLSVSNRITTGNKANSFLLLLLLCLIAFGVQACTCGIGMLFMGPFIQLCMAVEYLTMTGQPTAEQIRMPPGQRPTA